MKLKKRNTHKRVISSRITAPETRLNEETGKREPLLSYGDERNNHCHNLTTKELFLFAAGENAEGELPDGLDRLMDHKFVVHLDKNDKAIGLDVLPNRVYRSKVIPKSQEGVDTVKMVWNLNGAVCTVIQRPAGVNAARLMRLVAALDKLATKGVDINETTKFPGIGKVVGVSGDVLEVRLTAVPRAVSNAGQVYDAESMLN
jgi:hypothetical protein